MSEKAKNMNHPNPHLLGRFRCTSRPDEMEGGSWTNTDTIDIYYDQSQQLSFKFLLKTESNHGVSDRYEEGFVHQGSSPHEVQFDVRQRCKWWTSWGMGYDGQDCNMDIFGPQEYLQIFHLLDQEELARAIEDGFAPDETTMALVRQEGGLIYYRDKYQNGRDLGSFVPWERFLRRF
jgi:hypothetical protein